MSDDTDDKIEMDMRTYRILKRLTMDGRRCGATSALMVGGFLSIKPSQLLSEIVKGGDMADEYDMGFAVELKAIHDGKKEAAPLSPQLKQFLDNPEGFGPKAEEKSVNARDAASLNAAVNGVNGRYVMARALDPEGAKLLPKSRVLRVSFDISIPLDGVTESEAQEWAAAHISGANCQPGNKLNGERFIPISPPMVLDSGLYAKTKITDFGGMARIEVEMGDEPDDGPSLWQKMRDCMTSNGIDPEEHAFRIANDGEVKRRMN